MPRTTGARNNPKDPDKELAKVRRLFAKHGRTMPGDLPAASAERAADGGDDKNAAARSVAVDQAIFITDPAQQPGADVMEYQCGSCGADLPGALSVCPGCNCRLEWA